MREILFRGKGIDGNWYYGVLHNHNKSVISETVGQYTGLTDKNGKKIFDGDIGENIDGLFLVRWSNEKCAFVMSFYSYPQEELYLEEMWEDSEVIGNIHDNPELLKGGEG